MRNEELELLHQLRYPPRPPSAPPETPLAHPAPPRPVLGLILSYKAEGRGDEEEDRPSVSDCTPSVFFASQVLLRNLLLGGLGDDCSPGL